MKRITRAVTWRNAYSLIVTLDLEALPINLAFVSKAYQVFKTLQKQKLQVLHATFLFTPTEVDPQLGMLSQEVQPEEPLTPNRTQSIPFCISFAFAPLCVAFKHVSQGAALLGAVHSIKAVSPSEIPSKFPFSLSKWTSFKLHTRMPQSKRQICLHQAIPRVCFMKSHHATQLWTQMV